MLWQLNKSVISTGHLKLKLGNMYLENLQEFDRRMNEQAISS